MSAGTPKARDPRQRDLAAIHAARKQLCLDDETYRAVLARVSATCGSPCHSSADLSARQRAAVLDELRRLGATRPARGAKRASFPGRPHNAETAAMPATFTKVEALLADMRAPWSYADAIAKRMFGIERVAWVRKEEQLAAIVAALYAEQEKRRLNAAIDAALVTLAWEPEQVVTLLGPLRPNWRRHRPSLRLVLGVLKAHLPAETECS